jgi:hypothetical protein
MSCRSIALSVLCIVFVLVRMSQASVVGLWQFNDASGNVTDSSGNGNVGTLVGSNATLSASKPGFGNALTLTADQTNYAYAQIPGNYSLQIGLTAGSPWSVTAWAKENSDGFGLFYTTYGEILSQKDPAVPIYGLEYQSGTNGDEEYYMWDGNNTNLQISTGVTPTLDVWNHFAWVYNGSDYIFYLNGVEKYRKTVGSISLNYAGYTGALEIGANITKAASRNWDGQIDDVAVFNQALSPSDVSTVMGGSFAPYISPLTPPTSTSWNTNTFGLWTNASNWTPITQPSKGTIAIFGNATTKPTTVVADTAVTTAGIQFNHTQPYAIAGNGSITIDTNSGNGSISVLNAGASVTDELQLPINLAKDTNVSAAAGTILEFDSQLNLNGHALNVSGGGRVNINNDSTAGTAGSVVNTGLLGGAGTIKGSLTNNAGAKIAIDIAGTGPYGVQGLTVTGAAALAGSLNISLLNGFTPASGNTFTVLTAASVTNNGLTLTGSSAGFSLSVVGGTNLVLTYTSAGVLGDYNGDGVVDAADYTVWRDHLGQTFALPNRSPSNTGPISTADYTYWKSRFGASSGSGASSEGSVPEPTTLLLVTLAGCLFAGRKAARLAGCVLLASIFALFVRSANATVLTFDADISNTADANPPPADGTVYGPWGNGSTVVQEYGDRVASASQLNVPTAQFGNPPYWYNFYYGNNGEGYTPNVLVANQVVIGATNNTATRSWVSAGNLSTVAYPASQQTGPVKWYWMFTADSGYSVTLDSLDLVRFTGTPVLPATVSVYSGNDPANLGTQLFTTGQLSVSDVAQTISPEVTAQSLTLEFSFPGGANDPVYNYAADNIVFHQPGPPVLTASWALNGSGIWGKGANWSPLTVLNGTDKTAVFGNVTTSASTVVLDSNYTVKKLQFNHTLTYNLAGTGVLTLQADSGNSSIEVLNAGGSVTHLISTNTVLGSNTDVSVAAGTTLEFDNRLHLGSFNLSKTGSGTLKINNVVESTGGAVIGGAGAIGGSGTLQGDLVNTGATISPGNSPGMFTVGGNYYQSSAGNMHMELGGLTRGIDYDVLKVDGSMALDGGTLQVVFVNHFAPRIGDTFDIFDFGSASGHFSKFDLPSGYTWDTSRLLVDGTLKVSGVVPEPTTLALAIVALASCIVNRRSTSVP